MKVLFASRNADKLREMRNKVAALGIELLSPDDFPGLPEVEEDGKTLEDNAVKKARTLAKLTNLPTVADDTGLEVEALGGAPGVHSSRYAGPKATYSDNVDKLLQEMRSVPQNRRGARFRTVLAYVVGEDVRVFEGQLEGDITIEPRGEKGFGYDPVFSVREIGKTFAELPLEKKNAVSHRARAIEAWMRYLENQLRTSN